VIYRLTVFEADDVTEWLSVSTDPLDANPWMMVPDQWAESEINFVSGSASIGEIVVEVLDPQTGGTQAQRGLTAKLADSNGRSAMSGRRALVEDSDDGYGFRTIFDGVINRVELSDSLSSFFISIRDIRERERDVELFRFTETCSVVPSGVLNGYGIPYEGAPTSEWLVPPTAPLIGTFRLNEGQLFGEGYVDLSTYIIGNTSDGVPVVRAEVIMSDAAVAACASTGDAPRIRILWRAFGSSGAYTTVNVGSFVQASGTFVQTIGAWVGSEDGRPVNAASRIAMPNGFGLSNTLPTNNQSVEVIVQYIGETSEQWPLHIEEVTAGELIRDIYNGDYSDEDPKVRYDETSLLALTTPVRARITSPVSDAREWVERNLYVAAGAAPAIIDGKVHAVTYELPDVNVAVTELGNAEADVMPGWSQTTDDAVNVVEVTYPRDRSIAPDEPGYDSVPGDRIVSRDVVAIVPKIIPPLGERREAFRVDVLRAIGGPQNQPYSGDTADETGAQVAQRIGDMLTDRFALGGQTLMVRADRRLSDVEDLNVGDWVVVTTTWTPDYQTGERGGNRLGQIVARRDESPIRCELVIIDAGPDNQPLVMPTLGTLSQTGLGEVVVPIATAPSGAEARVDYAISTTQPAAGSPLWTFAGRSAASGSVTTPQLPAGRKVWIRARSEAPSRRPSGYTNPVQIDIDSTLRLRKIFAYVTGAGVEIHWIGNPAVAGVQIEYVQHLFGDEPDWDYADVVDADVSPKTLTQEFDRSPNQVLSFRVTPYPTFSGGTVSGTPGQPLESSVFIGLPENVPFGYVIATYDGGFVDFFAQGNQLAASGAWAIRIGTPPIAPDDPNAEATGDFEGDNAFIRQQITEPGSDPVWVGVWFYSLSGGQGIRGPRVLARAVDDLEPLLFNFREVDRTETTITYAWETNAAVDQVWVYKNTIALPQTVDPWPGANDLPDDVLTVNTYTVDIPADGFGSFLQFEPRTVNLQPGSLWRLVVSAEGVAAAVSLAKTTEEEDRIAGVGRLGVTVIDPDSVSTGLKYRTKEGAAAWSSLEVETNTPVDGVEYSRTVPLVEQHLSFIEYVLEFQVGGKNGIVTSLSAGFDAGDIPDIVVKGHVRQNGQVFAQISGDSDTRSVKVVAFRTGQLPGDIPAAVRAATAINGREITTGDLLDQPLVKGEQAFIFAFGYSLQEGVGLESSALAEDVVELREITAAYLVPVTAEERRNGSEIGFFEVRVEDPDGVATRVRSKVKEVASSGATTGVSTFQTDSNNPADQDLFNRSVNLVAKHNSQIIFEVQSNVAGELVTMELPSPIFDLGQIPDLIISLVIDAGGAASVQWSGDFDTQSVKIIAWLEGNEPANIATAVRAATALNGRTGQTGTLVTASFDGQKVFAAAFGYAEAGGAGYEGELEQTVAVFRKTDVSEAGVVIQSVLWQPDTGESGGTTIVDPAGGANRVAIWTARFSDAVRSYRVIVGPESAPTGSPVEANYYVAFTGPGLVSDFIRNLNTGGVLGGQNALQFPGSYDVNTTVQVIAYASADATGTAIGSDGALLLREDPLNIGYFIDGTDVIEGQALRAGSNVTIALVNDLPEISLDTSGLSIDLDDVKGAGTFDGSGPLVVASSGGANTIAEPTGVGQFLKSVTAGPGATYTWDTVTTGVTSITAGDALSGGGTGSVTLDVKPYIGTGSGFGQTAIENDSLAVVLGTDSANKAAPGVHTHTVNQISDATTVGQNLVKLTNPSAITFLRINANNTLTAQSAANFRTDIGLGTGDAPTFNGLTANGAVGIQASASTFAATHVPVFIANPAGTTVNILSRTVDQFRSDIGAGAGTVTSVGSGDGLAGGPITSSGSLSVRANGEAVANRGKTALVDQTGGGKALGVVLGTGANEAMPGNTPIPQGTVTSVSGGDGLTGTVTTSGSINMGTPSTVSATSTNSTTSTSHTHELDGLIADVTVSTDPPGISDTPARAGSLWFVI
jgi:hypothetical protein